MPSLHLSQIRKWLLHSPPAEWGIQQLRELLIGALRQGPIPQHVAFVMDGNRRFARNHQIETVEGHNLGFEALARILEVCYKSGVRVVTIYAFSIENFKRSKYEVDALMDMAKVKLSQLAQHGDLLDHYGASIRILGQRELVKPDVLEAVDRAVNLTSNNKRAILNVCFPYTSRDEITTAIRSTVTAYSQPAPTLQRPFSASHITQTLRSRNLLSGSNTSSPSPPSEPTSLLSDIEDSASSSTTLNPDSPPNHSSTGNDGNNGNVIYPDPESIGPQTLDEHMYTAGTPPLDLLVRTSGVERLSDFMLWQCHQDTQIVFLECLWPEFDLWNFLPVLVEWQWRRKKIEEKERPLGVGQVGRLVKVR
ncbi:MAG: cis-prenyltransferase [Candelina mexicana]|nr:MAG: cis-prenyltransferase [Candelina mexicana]